MKTEGEFPRPPQGHLLKARYQHMHCLSPVGSVLMFTTCLEVEVSRSASCQKGLVGPPQCPALPTPCPAPGSCLYPGPGAEPVQGGERRGGHRAGISCLLPGRLILRGEGWVGD